MIDTSSHWNKINEKYPNVMEYTTNECIGMPKVDESVLKTKAIWNIDPRCITIEITDRTVAKSIAEDVLKEKFTYIDKDVRSDNNESSGYYDEDIPLDTESEDVVRKEEEEKEEDTNTKGDVATLDEIDWDDI